MPPSPLLVRYAYDELEFLALDDSNFKESDHPRDADGKFTAGAGGGGGGAPADPTPSYPYKVTNHIKAVLKAAGYKPAKNPSNPMLVSFKNADTGAQVVIHPPSSGKKFSSQWVLKTANGFQKGEGINGITKLVQNTKSEATKVNASSIKNPAAKEAAEYAALAGFYAKPSGDHPGEHHFETADGHTLFIDEGSGDWTLKTANGMIYSDTLQDPSGIKEGLEAAKSETGTIDTLKKNGYEVIEKPDASGALPLKAPDGSKVYYNPKSGGWAGEKTAGKGITELMQTHGSEDTDLDPMDAGYILSNLPDNVQIAVKDFGLSVMPDSDVDGNVNFQTEYDNMTASYDNSDGSWGIHNSDNDATYNGQGAVSFLEAVKKHLGVEKEPEPIPVKPEPTPIITTNLPNASDLDKKGFNWKGQNGSVISYEKANGAKVEFDTATGQWLLKTPGYNSKKGEGAETLEKLTSGEKAYQKPDGKYSWENTSEETIVPESPEVASKKAAALQAAKEAQLKKQAEHKEKHAAEYAKQEGFNKTLSTLMKAAPQPAPAQKSAISKYTNGAYDSMNTALRSGQMPKSYSDQVKHLDTYLAGAKFPEDATIYRKVDGEYAKFIKSVAAFPGAAFVDRGFISTSTHQGVWHGSMQMVITVKKGQSGAAVKDWSQHSGENEVILPRNTMFKVTKMEDGGNTLHVEIDQTHVGK